MASLMKSVQDPLLKQVIRQVEFSLKPELQESYNQILAAGMTLMYSEDTFPEMDKYLDEIKGPEDVPKIISHGILKLLSVVQNESKQQEPLKAAGPACITLMAQALEFVEKKLNIQVDKQMVDETTTLIKEGIFSLYKITPDVLKQLQQGAAKGQTSPSTGAPPPPAETPQPEHGA